MCRRSSCVITRSSSAASSDWRAVAARGFARTTSRVPAGSDPIRPRISSRSRRRTLLRTTAPPTAPLTMNPARGGSADPSWTSRYPVSRARPARRPPRTAAVKSARRRIRAAAGSKGDLPFLRRGGADQALRRARPLRRRAARTARPALVRMRSRKPCVLARRRLFGWNVRLLTGTPGTVLGFWGTRESDKRACGIDHCASGWVCSRYAHRWPRSNQRRPAGARRTPRFSNNPGRCA